MQVSRSGKNCGYVNTLDVFTIRNHTIIDLQCHCLLNIAVSLLLPYTANPYSPVDDMRLFMYLNYSKSDNNINFAPYLLATAIYIFLITEIILTSMCVCVVFRWVRVQYRDHTILSSL